MIDSTLAFVASLTFAIIVDAILGDPVFAWHPVRLIGLFAALMEKITRQFLKPRIGGLVSWVVVVLIVSFSAGSLSCVSWHWNAIAGIVVDGLMLWISIAPRDLATHAARVWQPLSGGDLEGSRIALSMIVGRQTNCLDTAGIIRATVEAVAESTIDGILAPLFWAALLGPVAAMGYRAINTMDSIFGHKNQHYIDFGFVPAKADDLANWLPARISIAPILIAALILRLNARGAWQIFRRDRLKHESPNAAHAEAAFAGALGIQLGGPSIYTEGQINKPWLGNPVILPVAFHIVQAVWLMLLLTLGGVAMAIGLFWGSHRILNCLFH